MPHFLPLFAMIFSVFSTSKPPEFLFTIDIVQQPNTYIEDNPDIGYIWVFIDFSDSLDLLDEKKNHICPSQVLSNLFYGTFMKSGSGVKFIKGNMVEKKIKTLRFFSFANFHPENHPIENKFHNQS